ncbi:uncharacterized protein B0H64DRAFT_389201 [Chaetomium fimeti]|uniref:Zn(2)-C6 fungal-type domain-containing protein n=1 Tax=Chaetomium fimeti TaxID=1854472 RepID=A0AAE0HN74_9PEZI|nr:hypothetical protein B0H64DRAFT_389201 [Chaetomium fimeti]
MSLLSDAGASEVVPDPPQARPSPSASRRREKPQLSCNLCRRRKLRCDRQQPCSTCSSRGLACTYADNYATALSLPKPAAMHDRIVQLERLVMSLMPRPGLSSMSGPSPDPGPTPDLGPGLSPVPGANPVPHAMTTPAETAPSAMEVTTPMEVGSECGSMRMSASELRYVSGDHWTAILDGIADLKDHFDQEERFRLAQDDHDTVPGDATSGLLGPRSTPTLLLYGCRLPSSRAEILAALPPKSAVDRYISRYFNRLDLVHSIIHGPSFLREYEAFWTNITSVPVVWVGLLFSMISLALLASDASDTAHGDPEHRSAQIDLYREKTVQCLVIGEYTKSGPYVLETVIHYVYIELILRGDADKDIWFLFALEVNLAMRMGYHRDPSHFPGISPLQSEIRRRLWATVLQGDILISAQMGMPRMISDSKWDTAEPRNLSDTDFDENTAELPPPRPETELTPVLGIIARRRMFVALGAISDVTSAAQPCGYSEVMRVDGILQQAATAIPPPLKPKPLAISVTDTPEVIMARLFITHLFHKGQIMLHRRFLYLDSPSPDEDIFAYSRTACLDASIGALQIQHILDEETGPGGQLYTMRWRVSSIMNHTFLTATMVLCSMLHRGRTLQREDEILRALRRTRTIWMRASSGSREAKKAAETVSIVLARAGEGRGSPEHQYGNTAQNDEQGGGAMSLHQGTQGTMTADYVSTDGSHPGRAGIHGQDMLRQDSTSLGSTAFDPDRFVMPSLLGTFTPPDAQGQTINFNYSPGLDGMGISLDEWIQTNNRFTAP